MPGGRELYLHRVRMHTTIDLTPEEIHQLGPDEVARIEAELAALREEIGFEASSEETAMKEFSARRWGVYENAYDLYGRLVMEMFISCRLVLDTGMNYFGWDLERAREYMSARVVYSDVEVATELLRYSADIHGQALAYRIGNLEILRQRGKAEDALDDRFDIKAFHAAVIGSGAMPMVVLDEHIDWWIEQER